LGLGAEGSGVVGLGGPLLATVLVGAGRGSPPQPRGRLKAGRGSHVFNRRVSYVCGGAGELENFGFGGDFFLFSFSFSSFLDFSDFYRRVSEV